MGTSNFGNGGVIRALSFNFTDQVQGEQLITSPASTLGIADDWSLSIWANPGTANVYNNRVLFNIPDPNGILIQALSGGNGIRVNTTNSAGAALKDFRYGEIIDNNTKFWHHFLVTRLGNSVKLYLNGDLQTPTVLDDDNNGTMTDTSREIQLAGSAVGSWIEFISHVGLWNVELDQDNVSEIFRHKHGINLNRNVGRYTNAANLKHYWKLAEDPSDPISSGIGKDYIAQGTTPLNMIDDSSSGGMDETDVFREAPR